MMELLKLLNVSCLFCKISITELIKIPIFSILVKTPCLCIPITSFVLSKNIGLPDEPFLVLASYANSLPITYFIFPVE